MRTRVSGLSALVFVREGEVNDVVDNDKIVERARALARDIMKKAGLAGARVTIYAFTFGSRLSNAISVSM